MQKNILTRMCIITSPLEKSYLGNSFVVQWLQFCNFIAQGLGSIPGQGANNPQALRWSQKIINRGFPGGLVAKTSCSSAECAGLILGWEAKIPHASWQKDQKIK